MGLLTSTSLARLRHDQGRTAEARNLLQSVYDRFSERRTIADVNYLNEGPTSPVCLGNPPR